MAYDAFGNLTTAVEADGAATRSTTYAYDELDRLKTVTPSGGTASSFLFDALGRHSKRTTGAVVDDYRYQGDTQSVVQIATGPATTNAALDANGPRRRRPVILSTDVLFPSSRGRRGEVGITPSRILQILRRRYHFGAASMMRGRESQLITLSFASSLVHRHEPGGALPSAGTHAPRRAGSGESLPSCVRRMAYGAGRPSSHRGWACQRADSDQSSGGRRAPEPVTR
jgi:YD repeat-containing protein